MPAYGQTIRQRYSSRLLLNVAVVAWLSMVVMPCAVLAAGPVSAEAVVSEAVAPDCHGAQSESTSNASSSCCCDPLTVSSGEAPKTQRAELAAAITMDDPLLLTLALSAVIDRAQPPPPTDVGPPIYLVTQRFRI